MATIALPRPLRMPGLFMLGIGGLMMAALFLSLSYRGIIEIPADPDLRAFPGCEGFGCETTHGRGGTVIRVTNTNDSGAGSLRNALLTTGPRIIIFRVSGTISLSSRIELDNEHSNVFVAGQTAPGDGIALRMTGEQRPMLEFSRNVQRDNDDETDFFQNGLFQHLRFRHGYTSPADNIIIFGGSNRIVFDHNSFTWHGDEAIDINGGGCGTNVCPPVYDITFSHNIFGEANVAGHNYGPFFTGCGDSGESMYNIMLHHNLILHSLTRNPMWDCGSQSTTEGMHSVNNILYNISVDGHVMNTAQNTGCSRLYLDVIGMYFQMGPDTSDVSDDAPVESRDDGNVFGYGPCGSRTGLEPSLYYVGSTWRKQDRTPSQFNDEANNHNMVYTGPGGGQPGGTYVTRTTPLSTQPEFPVTVQNFDAAYSTVVLNEDVGASKPAFDSVDQRLVDAPVDGDAYDVNNTPPTASYPTLNTSGVPTDTDSDGVPDAYEISPLGTDPNVFESQAVLDHDGDGYSNIEEWIHSL